MGTYKKMFSVLMFGLYSISCSGQPGSDPPSSEPANPDGQNIQTIDDEIRGFMGRYDVPGLSLAITKDGNLVYAKGYGWADKEMAAKVDTSSTFRIASLSKFITSIGIMTLQEKGALSLGDKVFGQGAILGTNYGTPPYSEYVRDITIRDLLQHQLGGWANSSDDSDPAFERADLMTVGELISWTLDNRPLENPPGTVFDYSNLGYQILGLVIEKLSSHTYAQFIQKNVLTAAGITNMHIAGGGRAKNEVRYYGQDGREPFSYGSGVLSRLNSAGGWIASAIDLMRIMVRSDGFNTVPDMLDPSTIEMMTTPSDSSNYAFGLYVNSLDNWWHSGSLTGTETWIVRAHQGFNWVILMNTKSYDGNFISDLDGLIWPAVYNADTHWPEIDLF